MENIKEVLAQKPKIKAEAVDDVMIKVHSQVKTMRKGKRSDYAPTMDELKLINERVTKEDVEADAGYVVCGEACNTDPDRGDEQFTPKSLTKMGQKAVENLIPLLLAQAGDFSDHTWMAKNTRGVVFDAEVVNDSKLVYKIWIPKTDSNKDFIEDVFSGLISKLSVGFSMDYMSFTCSACGNPLASKSCPHQPGDVANGKKVLAVIDDIIDNYEISCVAVPMQPKASLLRDSKSLEIFSGTLTEVDAICDVPSEAKSLEIQILTVDDETGELVTKDPDTWFALDTPITTLTLSDGKTYSAVKLSSSLLPQGNENVASGNYVLKLRAAGTITNDTIEDSSPMDEPNTQETQEDVAKEAAIVDLSKLEANLSELSQEVKTLAAKEVDLSAIEEKINSLSDAVAKALEVINDNLKKLDDKVEASAKAPVLLETKTFKEDHKHSPIESVLFSLTKQQ